MSLANLVKLLTQRRPVYVMLHALPISLYVSVILLATSSVARSQVATSGGHQRYSQTQFYLRHIPSSLNLFEKTGLARMEWFQTGGSGYKRNNLHFNTGCLFASIYKKSRN
jgi:hypothetical protein